MPWALSLWEPVSPLFQPHTILYRANGKLQLGPTRALRRRAARARATGRTLRRSAFKGLAIPALSRGPGLPGTVSKHHLRGAHPRDPAQPPSGPAQAGGALRPAGGPSALPSSGERALPGPAGTAPGQSSRNPWPPLLPAPSPQSLPGSCHRQEHSGLQRQYFPRGN